MGERGNTVHRDGFMLPDDRCVARDALRVKVASRWPMPNQTPLEAQEIEKLLEASSYTSGSNAIG